MKKTKIIANYLPQYHSIPENDNWWGEGYTDWVAVKKSVPLYDGHLQPKVPLSNNYYQLNNIEVIRWQAEIAKKYGIDGFGIYHYWFDDNLHLLDKPVKLLYQNKDIDLEYMFIWDNSSWVRSWSNVKMSNDWAPIHEEKVDKQGRGILAELVYGDKSSWKKHFDYLLPFFKDSRYIKLDNKPVFAIYNQNNQSEILAEMCNYWNELAIDNGFSGVYIIGKVNNQKINITENRFLYQPEWNGWVGHNVVQKIWIKLKNVFFIKIIKQPLIYDYDKIWKKILETAEKFNSQNIYFSGFVNYDDTPRRGRKGKIVKNSSPQKFERYIRKLIQLSIKSNNPLVFITAWNEWGEGAYLEPDEEHGYSYLESLKKAIESIENGVDS